MDRAQLLGRLGARGDLDAPTYLSAFACGIGAAILVHGRTMRPVHALALILAGGAVVAVNAVWHSGGGTGAAGVIVGDLPASVGFAAIVAAAALPRVLAPAVVLAGASWVLVERPASRWSSRVTRRARAVTPRAQVAVR